MILARQSYPSRRKVLRRPSPFISHNFGRVCAGRDLASAGFPRVVERHRILDIARARKLGAERSQVRVLPFRRRARNAGPHHRRQRPCRSSIPGLHHQPVFSGVILHTAEDDQPVSWRFDLVVEQLEAAADAERGDLALDQPLRGLRQRPLRLSDTDRQRATLGLAGLDQQLAEEMRFTRTAAAVNPLVAGRHKQRLEHLRCRNSQDGQ